MKQISIKMGSLLAPLVACAVLGYPAPARAAFDLTKPAVGERKSSALAGLKRSASDETLVWQRDLDSAMADAAGAYRPIFVLFTSPDCGWCFRLKRDVLSSPEVVKLLKHYTLVEIDTQENAEMAQQFQLRGVPSILILAADGRPRNSMSGYAPAGSVAEFLGKELNPNIIRKQDSAANALLAKLQSGELGTNQWSEVMLALGNETHRSAFWSALLALDSLPGKQLVPLLEDSQLAIRLGSIDLLEEVTGEAFGYDPWLRHGHPDNHAAIEQWQHWAAGITGRVDTVYMTLTQDALQRHLQNLVGDDIHRAQRAMRMLQAAGPSAAEGIATFLDEHPELPKGAVQRIKEIQYALWLPDLQGFDALALAHHLTFGTLDMQLNALRRLRSGGVRSLPVLRDFLNASEGIVRETAVESILLTARSGAIKLITEHVETEADPDVLYAILRTLGQIRSKRGLALLEAYTGHENEDLAAVALASLGALKSKLAIEAINTAFSDERWRVRVAALEAAGKLKFEEFHKQVMARLDDTDGFVRHTAIKTLVQIKGDKKKTIAKLKLLLAQQNIETATVAAALVSMAQRLPASLATSLPSESDDRILAVIGALDDCNVEDLDVVMGLATHENMDISCGVLRLLATKGRKKPRFRAVLVNALKTGTVAQQRTVSEVLAESAGQQRYTSSYSSSKTVDIDATTISLDDLPGFATTPVGESAPEGDLDDLFAAFDSPDDPPPPAAPAPAPVPEPEVSVDDLFSAFDIGDDAVAVTPDSSVVSAAPVKTAGESEMTAAMQQLLTATDDADIRFDATLFLLASGETNVLQHLGDTEERPVKQRVGLVRALAATQGDAADALLARLLVDPSESVRKAAGSACLQRTARSQRLALLLEALDAADAVLRPYDFDFADDVDSATSGKKRALIAAWSEKHLAGTNRNDMTVAALAAAKECWKKAYIPSVEALTKHESPWVRRAAFETLGRKARSAFPAHVASIASDPSEHVRVVLPAIYNREWSYWTHYFDAAHTERVWSSSSSSRTSKLPESLREPIKKLTEDPSTLVRVEAFFCLLSNRIEFNIDQFQETIDSLPDRKSAVQRVASHMVSNYSKLGRGFAALLPYLDEARQSDTEVDKVFKHFNRSRDEEIDVGYAFVARTNTVPVLAEFLDTGETNAIAESVSSTLTVLYFTSPGCSDCARVSELLARLRGAFPNLEVRRRSIKKTDAMLHNEALCDTFNVPAKLHLVAPAVFGAAGGIVKHEITSASLAELLSRSSQRSDDAWLNLRQEEIKAAEVAITERYKATGLWVVCLAGFLDGINPCAFATIIFFLSYLQVTKRRPREILQIGSAFIFGVFLAYFAMGLGLHELVEKLDFLQRFGSALNWGVASFAVIIMVLSVRDGILCLRGRMKDMTLQLPDLLKSQIHSVIRKGSRHRRFIVAAFVIGVVISVLELACTGQVYLPTILFVLKQSPEKASAIWMLALYNVAFIVPLVVIFGLAHGGMRSDSLVRFMQRHAALVKFATALLFLLLFVMFAFGDQITAFSHGLEIQ
jgi:HEAT repeat protein/cytochrome c biogenesis protein CcdA/thiol-disulfide isomerase/thioredoxin